MKTRPPVLDSEKQTTPQKGETAPEDALSKARLFAAQIKNRQKTKGVPTTSPK
jgi:hypothetical protein